MNSLPSSYHVHFLINAFSLSYPPARIRSSPLLLAQFHIQSDTVKRATNTMKLTRAKRMSERIHSVYDSINGWRPWYARGFGPKNRRMTTHRDAFVLNKYVGLRHRPIKCVRAYMHVCCVADGIRDVQSSGFQCVCMYVAEVEYQKRAGRDTNKIVTMLPWMHRKYGQTLKTTRRHDIDLRTSNAKIMTNSKYRITIANSRRFTHFFQFFALKLEHTAHFKWIRKYCDSYDLARKSCNR